MNRNLRAFTVAMLAFAITMFVSHSLIAAAAAMCAVGVVFFLIRRLQGA